MKKTMSLIEQVHAARVAVNSWPESVKSATDIRHSDFFHEEDESDCSSTKRPENDLKKEVVL